MYEAQDDGHGEESPSGSIYEAAAGIESLLSDDSEDQHGDDPETDTEAPEGHADSTDEEPKSDDEAKSEGEDEAKVEKPVQPRTRKLKVDGEEVEVTDEELEKGYSRTADYTRKTQKLSDERKAFESEAAAVRAERQQYATELTQLSNAIQSMTREPDWDKLRQENPEAFPQAFAEWQLHQKNLQALEAKRQEAVQAVQRDQYEAHQNLLKDEFAKLVDSIPEWKDAEVRKKGTTELQSYAQTQGFTPEQIANVTDHRVFQMLHKAMLYDQGKADAAKAKPLVQEKIDKATVVVPGSKGDIKNPATEFARRKQRAAKTGNIRDVASSIELLLAD